MRFHFNYFCVFLVLLGLEIGIAVFVRDTFVRPILGDVLVIILVYAGVRVFWGGGKQKLVLTVFLFACLVEIGQYFHLINMLNLQDIKWVRIVIGSTFDSNDLFAYAAGAAFLVFPDFAGIRLNWFP